MAFASWPQRVGGYIIDALPGIVLTGIGRLTGNGAIIVITVLASLGIVIYNRWIQAGRTGQSWGKQALGIRLVSEQTGQPIGAAMAFVRDLAHIIDGIICYIGFLFPLWTPKKQTLADMIVKTVVVPA